MLCSDCVSGSTGSHSCVVMLFNVQNEPLQRREEREKKGREVEKKKRHKDGEVRSDHRKREKGEKEKIVVVKERLQRERLRDIALFSLSLSLLFFFPLHLLLYCASLKSISSLVW